MTRRRRRGVALALAAPVALALATGGAVLVAVPLLTDRARADYATQRYGQAVEGFTTTDAIPGVERWKTTFNLGTARIANGDADGGIAPLLDAAHRAQGEPADVQCAVQTNLAIAYEAVGDDATRRGDAGLIRLAAVEKALAARAVGQPFDATVLSVDGAEVRPEALRQQVRSMYREAIQQYLRAELARGAAPCRADDTATDDPDPAAAARDRLRDKRRTAQDAQPTEPEMTPRPAPSTPDTTDPAETERQRKLAEQNAAAREQEERGRRELSTPAPRDRDGRAGGSGSGNW